MFTADVKQQCNNATTLFAYRNFNAKYNNKKKENIPGTPTAVNGHTEILKMDKSTGKKWAKNSGFCLKSLNLTCMYVSHDLYVCKPYVNSCPDKKGQKG